MQLSLPIRLIGKVNFKLIGSFYMERIIIKLEKWRAMIFCAKTRVENGVFVAIVENAI